MKKSILLFIAMITGHLNYAQSNNGFSYKALLTDEGEPVINQLIDVKATFYDSDDNLIWQEKHTVSTNENGIFSIYLGEGTKIIGVSTFSDINWGQEGLKLSIEIDKGSGYTLLVDKEPLKSVPYAQTSAKIENDYIYTDKNGSLRFIAPSTIGYDYIKKSADDGIEMGYYNIFTSPPSDVSYFKVNNSGIWVKGIDVNGDINATGNLNIDGNALVKNELNSEISGDADMKAYIYGSINSDGTIINDNSSEGFTVFHAATGAYLIKFNESINSHNYMVVATAYARLDGQYKTTVVGYVQQDDQFYLITRDQETGDYIDIGVNFIVYKK